MTHQNSDFIRHLTRFKPPLLPTVIIAMLPLIGFAALHYADSVILMIICLVISVMQYRKWRRYQRAQYIQHYQIPLYVLHDLRREHQLRPEQLPLIERGFKDFCLIHLDHPRQLHNMPSKAVDALWHAFILDTRGYADFCRRAFGRMLHHRPSLDMQTLSNTTQQNALKSTWLSACQLENIVPTHAVQLPLLFMLDQHLAWSQGLHYSMDQLQHLLRVRDASSSCGGGGGGSCGGTTIDVSDSSDSGCGGGCGGD